jgi:hypothetical protein
MRIALVTLIFAATAFAQGPPAVPTAACGSGNGNFKVKLDDTQHTLAQPAPGKALVYFIQDKGGANFGMGGTVGSDIGLDGAWVGANKNNSYFSISVEPGEHHAFSVGASMLGSTYEYVHFIAEAGKVYFIRARFVGTHYGLYLFLAQTDDDQGKQLIASYPLSVSKSSKQDTVRQSEATDTR